MPCPHCGQPVVPGAKFCTICGKSVVSGGAVAAKRSGMPPVAMVALGIAGCFGLIAITGIIAAILIPNLLDALQKAKTKRTVADMETVGLALASWASENGGTYPMVSSIEELAGQLEAAGASLARSDGWQNELIYRCRADVTGPCASYRLVSAGRDGLLAGEDLWELMPGEIAGYDYDADLVRGAEGWIRFPAWAGSP